MRINFVVESILGGEPKNVVDSSFKNIILWDMADSTSLFPSRFQESILPPITHPKIPAQLTRSEIKQKKEKKTMIFAVVEMG